MTCDNSHKHAKADGWVVHKCRAYPDALFKAFCKRLSQQLHEDKLARKRRVQAAPAIQGGRPSILSVADDWIFDSGCGNDLVSKEMVSKWSDYIGHTHAVDFHTAGGLSKTSRVLKMNIPVFMDEPVMAYIMDNTPAVLSMGRRVREKRLRSIWVSGRDPVAIRPDLDVVVMKVWGDIPYIDREHQETMAMLSYSRIMTGSNSGDSSFAPEVSDYQSQLALSKERIMHCPLWTSARTLTNIWEQ